MFRTNRVATVSPVSDTLRVMALQDNVKLFVLQEWEWVDGRCGNCGNRTNLAVIGGTPLL